MWGVGVREFVTAAGTFIVLGGCQMVGPIAIDQGRDRYNHIIQSTAKEQTLSNILRVHYHEPTAFMDVTEVDATSTFSGNVSGGVTGIGARAGTSGGTLAGQVGAVAGGVTYSESPLIRYQPLLGQSLVAQLATPVSPDVLAALYDSNWGAAPLLDFAASFLTLDYDNLYAALNVIAELDNDNVLEFVAEKSDVTKAKDATSGPLKVNPNGNVTLQVTNKAAGAGGTDALVIYYLPDHAHGKHSGTRGRNLELWNRLRQLYANTQARPTGCDSRHPDPAQGPGTGQTSGADPKGTASPRPQICPRPFNYIELRTTSVPPGTVFAEQLRSGAPLMKTYSALGILKNLAEQPHPRIGFVTLELYNRIRSRPWNDPGNRDHELTFYTLHPDDENKGDERPVAYAREKTEDRIASEVGAWLQRFGSSDSPPFVYEPRNGNVNGEDYLLGNRQLGYLRRYVLIIRGEVPPANAYVSHFDHGEWYYIDGNDEISQKNFNLISLFLTMMAVPSATPPLSPSISVGGG
jgi:hypothetical protein